MKNNKKQVKIYLFCLLAAAFFAVGVIAGGKNEETKASKEADVRLSSSKKETPTQYTVMLFEGTLYVYSEKDGERRLLKKKESVFPRENDIAQLAKGIKTENLDEAMMLFEDFSS